MTSSSDEETLEELSIEYLSLLMLKRAETDIDVINIWTNQHLVTNGNCILIFEMGYQMLIQIFYKP